VSFVKLKKRNKSSQFLAVGVYFLTAASLISCTALETSTESTQSLTPNMQTCQVIRKVWPDFWNGATKFWNWYVVTEETKIYGYSTNYDKTSVYLAHDLREDWKTVQTELETGPSNTTGVMQEVRDLMLSYTADEYRFIDNMKETLDEFKNTKSKIDAYCD